jgi:acyl dehydratase
MKEIFQGSADVVTSMLYHETAPENPEDRKTYTDQQVMQAFQAALKERGVAEPLESDIPLLGHSLEDYNPIHRIRRVAARYELPDILFMGTHTSGLAERVIQSAVTNLRGLDGLKNLKIVGQRSVFNNPVHPGDKIEFAPTRFNAANGFINIDLVGNVKRRKEDPIKVVEVSAKLGEKYGSTEHKIAGPFFSREFLVDQAKLQSYWEAMRSPYTGNVPQIYAANLAPSAMLELLRSRTGRMDGINNSMSFNYVRDPKPVSPESPQTIQVDLFKAGKPKVTERGTMYKMRIAYSQEGKLLGIGDVTCSTLANVDF